MVKCFTKKKNDGSNYTACVDFNKKTKKTTKGKTIRINKSKTKSKLKGKTITINKSKTKGRILKIKKKKAKPTAKGVKTIQKKIKTTRKLKNKSTIKPPLTKSKAKAKPKSRTRMLTPAEVIFGRGGLGGKQKGITNILKTVKSYRKGGKKGLMKNYVTVKQVKNWFKDKGNRRWFDDTFDEEVFYLQEQSMNENDYFGALKVKISSGRKSKRGGDKYWQIPYGEIHNLAEQTGRDLDDLKDNIIDYQGFVAKKGSVAKAGRKYIKELIEEAKNKKISFDFDKTFQQFNMEDYIKTDMIEHEDRWGEEIDFKQEWRGM